MTSKLLSSSDYEIRCSDEFFLDTNIWILLYCPIANYEKSQQTRVSKFYEKLLNKESYLVINSLVLSEFSNAYLRIDFNIWKNKTKQYGADFKKDYFNTDRSKDVRRIISNTIKNKILPTCQRHPDSFNSVDFEIILDHYKSMDFNDSMIAERCVQNNWKLFTNDQDFINVENLVIIKP